MSLDASRRMAASTSSATAENNIATAQDSGDFAIKPETETPKLDTSNWPLLLKVSFVILLLSSDQNISFFSLSFLTAELRQVSRPFFDCSRCFHILIAIFDRLLVRSSHFTPIPVGCSPLKRDIQSYVKYAILQC
jgi:H/ACA ribonucleoprotein complex subunit 4